MVAALGHDVLQDEEPTLLDLARIVYRYRLMVLGFVCFGISAGILLLALATPRYQAEALLLIQPDRGGTVQELVPATGVANDAAAIDSQVRILASRSLAAEVVELLQLQDDLGFHRANKWLETLSLRAENTKRPGLDETVSLLQSRLKVKRDGKTYVISVVASDDESRRAAEIANTLTDRYIVRQLTARFEATRRATNWLDSQLSQARVDMQSAEAALASFRGDTGGNQAPGLTNAGVDTADLKRDLISATAERAGLEAELYQIRKNVRDDPDTLIFEETGGSSVLQNLYAQRNRLVRQQAELSGQFGDRHPRIVDLRAEIVELEARMTAERQALVARLGSKVEQARVRQRTLADEIDKIKAETFAQQSTDSRIASLERQVELSRQGYETYLARFDEIADREDVARPDAQVISKAVAAAMPEFPKPATILPLVFSASLIFALIAIYVIEQLDRGFATEREIARRLGIPCLALLPDIKRREGKVTKPCDYGMSRPRSRYGEAIRGMLPAIAGLDAPGGIRRLLVTSSVPDEGKSTTALSLARVAAGEGLKVLLVDADVRRPRVDRLLGLDRAPGLSDVLGGMELEDALRDDPRSALTVLTAGEVGETHRVTAIGALLRSLPERFDLVVVDSAPVLAAADARILADFVDSILLIVRWRRTSKAVVQRCCERLADVRQKLRGVALSLVDLDAHARLGGAEAMLGGQRMAEYYRD